MKPEHNIQPETAVQEPAGVPAEPTKDESGRFVAVLSHPVKYNGADYTVLTFDFTVLTGRDTREVIAELWANGINVAANFKKVHEDYLQAMAARAIVEKTVDNTRIGADVFDNMRVGDVNRIIDQLLKFL